MVTSRPISREDLEHVLAGTAELWEGLRGEQIFITGGTGFFGCWLLESFCYINRKLELKARATVLTRSPEAFRQKAPHVAADLSVSLLEGDVRDFNFPEGRFGYVIHAATDTRVRAGGDAPLEMLTAMVDGTARVLEFAKTHGTVRFLLTSSGAVYGKQPAEMTHVPETYAGGPDPLDAGSAYGEAKRVSELMCALSCRRSSSLECAIARCWAFVGPHLPLDAGYAVGSFLGDVLAGRPIQIGGDGTARRSYLYGSDLAIWLWTMLFRAPSLVPINVGSANDLSIFDLASTMAQTLKTDAEIHVAREAVAGAAPSRYVPSVERARELLGLKETIGLVEAIQRTVDWYLGDERLKQG